MVLFINASEAQRALVMVGSTMEFALDLNLIYSLAQDGSLCALTKLKEHFIHCCGAYEW